MLVCLTISMGGMNMHMVRCTLAQSTRDGERGVLSLGVFLPCYNRRMSEPPRPLPPEPVMVPPRDNDDHNTPPATKAPLPAPPPCSSRWAWQGSPAARASRTKARAERSGDLPRKLCPRGHVVFRLGFVHAS